MATPNIETIIRDHVTLTIDRVDRLYLNGYVPTLQTSGQLSGFLQEHLGNPIPSPALLREWTTIHRHRTVTTEQFEATARRHATRPLEALFTAWLRDPRLSALPTREAPRSTSTSTTVSPCSEKACCHPPR